MCERESVCESVYMCVCVCVCERERVCESVYMCVCVCVRKRERVCEGVCTDLHDPKREYLSI